MTYRGKAIQLEPDTTSLVASQFDSPDYQDRFYVSVQPDQYETVDHVATDWFTKQPAWLVAVSTNTLSRSAILRSLSDHYTVGDNVGSWKVFARDTEEIVFGDHMGFMEYRSSFRLRPKPSMTDQSMTNQSMTVESATSVKFLWGRSAKFYFACVRPVHRRFIQQTLITATRSSAN